MGKNSIIKSLNKYLKWQPGKVNVSNENVFFLCSGGVQPINHHIIKSN